jgi:hypothetical protein
MLENNQENLHESEVSTETVNKQKKEKKEEFAEEAAAIENAVEVEKIAESGDATQDDVTNSAEEEKVDAQSQKETKKPVIENEVSKPEVIDYSTMTMEQLLAELQSIINNHEVHEIKRNIDLIKKEFNRKHSELLHETKKAFLDAGNESIDFHFDNPLKQEFDIIYQDYASKRRKYYTELDTTLKQNLAARTSIIDELKNLIDNGDSSDKYKDFKNLQQRWNEIGAVPRNRYNDTWKTYQHHVERFYDLLHINKDLRDLDFKHNLQEKQKLIAVA